MNILIKLTCLVGLVIAPILGGHNVEEGMALATSNIEVERSITVETNDTSKATAVVKTIKTLENGDRQISEKSFEGTLDEVTKEASAYAKEEKDKNN